MSGVLAIGIIGLLRNILSREKWLVSCLSLIRNILTIFMPAIKKSFWPAITRLIRLSGRQYAIAKMQNYLQQSGLNGRSARATSVAREIC